MLSFALHRPDQRPYENRSPLIGYARLDSERKIRQLLMNSRPTPQGNVSRRVSIQYSNGSWYYRDDAKLRAAALMSREDGPLSFKTIV